MNQLALFEPPRQKKPRHWDMAADIYAEIIKLRRAGAVVLQEGSHITVDGRRLSKREFRRAYGLSRQWPDSRRNTATANSQQENSREGS